MKLKYMKDKISTIIVFSILFVIFFRASYVTIKGNPIRKFALVKSSGEYLKKEYPNEGFYVDNIEFNPRYKYYTVYVRSKRSVDGEFPIWKLKYDKENWDIEGLFLDEDSENFETVSEEYEKLIQKMEKESPFSMPILGVGGSLEGVYISEESKRLSEESVKFERNKRYDVNILSKASGTLRIEFKNTDPSYEDIAKMLLEVKEYCDRNDIYFSNIDTYMSEKLGERRDFYVESFRYEDIYEEGLIERVMHNSDLKT